MVPRGGPIRLEPLSNPPQPRDDEPTDTTKMRAAGAGDDGEAYPLRRDELGLAYVKDGFPRGHWLGILGLPPITEVPPQVFAQIGDVKGEKVNFADADYYHDVVLAQVGWNNNLMIGTKVDARDRRPGRRGGAWVEATVSDRVPFWLMPSRSSDHFAAVQVRYEDKTNKWLKLNQIAPLGIGGQRDDHWRLEKWTSNVERGDWADRAQMKDEDKRFRRDGRDKNSADRDKNSWYARVAEHIYEKEATKRDEEAKKRDEEAKKRDEEKKKKAAGEARMRKIEAKKRREEAKKDARIGISESRPAESVSGGGKRSRRKKTKRRHKTGGKKSRKQRKRATIKGSKRKRRRTRG